MATIMYDGKQIAGGGVSIVHMTEAQYLANKQALDASDLLIEITDKDYPVEAGNIGFTPPTGMSATNVQGAIEEGNARFIFAQSQTITTNQYGNASLVPPSGYRLVNFISFNHWGISLKRNVPGGTYYVFVTDTAGGSTPFEGTVYYDALYIKE